MWGPDGVLFAGIMMIVGGFFGFFEGLGALLKSGRFYANVSTNYPYGTGYLYSRMNYGCATCGVCCACGRL